MNLSIIDAVIIVALGYFIYKGWRKGLTDSLIGLIGLLIVLFFAIRWMGNIGNEIRKFFPFSRVTLTILGFLTVFIPGWLIMRNVIKQLQVKINPVEKWKKADKVVGILLGLVEGGILVSLLTMLIVLTPASGTLHQQRESSYLLKPALLFAPTVFDGFTYLFPEFKSFTDELEEGFGPEGRELTQTLEKKKSPKSSSGGQIYSGPKRRGRR